MDVHLTGGTADDRDLFLAAARLPLHGHFVLVLDDDAEARAVLRAVLEAEGAEVITAGSAATAFFQIERLHPDVVLTDIGMPVVDGFTFVEQLRQKPADAGGQTPVAALTGYISAEDRERAQRAGFQAYLLKPVDPADLIDTVKVLASARTCAATPDIKEESHA